MDESSLERSPQSESIKISFKDRISGFLHRQRPPSVPESPEPLTEIVSQSSPVETSLPPQETNDTPAQESKEAEIVIPVEVYVGLEQLDVLHKDVPLLQGGIAAAPEGERKELFKATLKSIDDRKREILDRYNLQPLIDADVKRQKEKYPTTEPIPPYQGKHVAQLLIDRAAEKLPPLKEGYIRMYRGEGVHDREDGSWSGTWFSNNLLKAAGFPIGPLTTSRMLFVDIPRESLREYSAERRMPGSSKLDEYLIPHETVTKAREFIRFLNAGTKGDPWERTNVTQ